MSDQSDDS